MELVVCWKRRSLGRPAFFFGLAVLVVPPCAPQSGDPALLSRQVKELMSQRRFEEAIPLCEQLVTAMPGNPGLLLNLGLAEEMAGYPAKAIPRFEEVLRHEPANVPALSSLAAAQLELNHPQLALAPLKKLLAQEPSNQEAREMLAGALLGLESFDEAAAQYRKLTAADPANAKAWYGLGSAYEAWSAHALERISQHSAESPYAAALIAYSRLDQQQYRSAFFFFRLAEQQLPKLRGLHAGLAVVYRQTGHPEWAALEEKVEEGLPAPSCSAGPAECYFVQNRYLESAKAAVTDPSDPSLFWASKACHQLALEAFSRLSALPESVELHAVKAKILHSHNQDIQAAKEWRAALRLAPGNRGLKNELATSLFLAHDYQPAMALIEELMARDSSSGDLNFMMGESLLRTEQPGKAVAYLETALRADHQMLPAHASLGLSLAKLDRGSDAIPHLEKALTLDDDGSLHYALARAYQQTGNLQRSRELMVEYQRIQKQNQAQKDELAKETQIGAPEK